MIALPTPRSHSVLVAALAVALPLALFVPHAIEAWQHDVSAWDERLSVAIHEYENRETILNRHVDVLGVVLHPLWSIVGIVAVVAVAYSLLRRGEARTAAAVLVGVGGAVVLGPVLKELFARPPVDPSSDGYTFPSGHALRSLAVALVFALVAWPTRWRWPVTVAGAVVVALVGTAVVYHEWHWISDVLAAWCLGVAWVGGVWLALRPSPSTLRVG